MLKACGLPPSLAVEDAAAFVAVGHDGSLVGCAAGEPRGSVAVLDHVAVLPQAQGQGVGTTLVNSILRQLRAAGIQSITARAIGSRDFLRRFGFIQLPSGARAGAAAPMTLDMRGATLVEPAARGDMPAVLAIYNDAVAQSTATYDYEPRALDDQLSLFDQKMQDGYAFFVARGADGTVAGFSTYGLYRTRPGWRFACEHSVYVAAPWRGRGVGLTLLPPIMWHARKRGFHTMVGVVDADNLASVRMHQGAGFTLIGTMREGGYKFDRWLDVAFLQAML